MIQLHRASTTAPSARGGTTLSEVLISLLVMSVGVVALATLFPISVLRSVQATQLTNSTNLRYNVEALINTVPQIYTIGSPWESSTAYAQYALVTPTQYSSLKYPPLVALCTTAGSSGLNEPNWLSGNPLNDGLSGLQWQVFVLQNYIVDPQGEYVAKFGDATGLLRGPPGGTHVFGNNGAGPYGAVFAFAGVNFGSTAFGSASPLDDYRAASFSTLPDSWVSHGESNLVSYTPGNMNCTLGGLKGLLSDTVPAPFINGAGTPVPPAYTPSRVVLFDITGKVSYTRPIMSISGSLATQTIDWTMPGGAALPTGPSAVMPSGPLPASFVPVSARVETQERRFSWLLSVRRGMSGSSSMDVVVFFRRQFSPKDERVYPATFQTGAVDPVNSNAANGIWAFYGADPGYDALPGIGGVDDDQLNGTDDPGELGSPGSDDVPRNWVVVQYDASGDKPFYKKGGFVTDAVTLRWYRITDVIEGDVINGYTPTAVMTKAGLNTASPYYTPDAPVSTFSAPRAVLLRLEKPIEQSGGVPTGGPGGVPTGGAIMMRGVVDVFPMRSQMSWDN